MKRSLNKEIWYGFKMRLPTDFIHIDDKDIPVQATRAGSGDRAALGLVRRRGCERARRVAVEPPRSMGTLQRNSTKCSTGASRK